MCLCSFACSVCRFVADFVKTPRRVVKKNLRPDQCTTYLFEPYGTLKSPSARKPLLFSGTSLHSLLDQLRSLLVLESHQDWIIGNSLLNIYNIIYHFFLKFLFILLNIEIVTKIDSNLWLQMLLIINSDQINFSFSEKTLINSQLRTWSRNYSYLKVKVGKNIQIHAQD